MRKLILINFASLLTVSTVYSASTQDSIDKMELRSIPVNYRTDGFSQYTHKTFAPTRQGVEKSLIAPLADGGISAIEWGCNAGTTSTYGSAIEPTIGAQLTPQDWKQMRELDYLAYSNLKKLIDSGNDPLKVAIDAAHKRGLKLFARMEMSRGYGSVKQKSWGRTLFNGKFSKEHPEYRIPGRLHLDFKYKAVRDYKLSLLREMAQKGCDGIMADFVSNPIYFADPEKGRPIMTQFIRDIRKMLDEEGAKQNRRLELFIRVNYHDSYDLGLDWKTCMKEGLIDYISVFKGWPASDYFDYQIDEFVAYRNKINSKCKVYGHIWQALGLVDTDPRPNSKKRYTKPKTIGMYTAQAALHNMAGADGLELGFASPQQWRNYFGMLGTPEKVEFADKHYMVDIKPYLPMIFPAGQSPVVKKVKLRVADNVAKALKAGLKVNTCLILTGNLQPEGKLTVTINGKGKVEVCGNKKSSSSFITTEDIKSNATHTTASKQSFLNDPNWYKRGRTTISFPAEWLKLKDNEIGFSYTGSRELEIRWIELLVEYSPKQGISAYMQKKNSEDARLKQLKKLYDGPRADTRAELKTYTGKSAVDSIVGEWRKAAYLGNYRQLEVNYGNNVDFQLRQNQIILCPQTAELLYSKEMVPKTSYSPGSRPELEKLVAGLTANCKTTQEKVLAVIRYCRDLKNKPTKKWGPGFIFGGTEEQLIEKGEDLCECLGRLFVTLCEIADIPARIVMHDIGGHITAETYIDDKWGYIDPKTGLYFLNTDGNIASVWDIMLYPEIMNEQPASVKTDLHPKYSWDNRVAKCRRKYFDPKEINGFEYYSLKDSGAYNYRQTNWESIHESGFEAANKEYAAAIEKVFPPEK